MPRLVGLRLDRGKAPGTSVAGNAALEQQMKAIQEAAARLGSSAVLWFWGANALRFGSGLFLLPLLLHHLTREDLGYFYILQNLFAIVRSLILEWRLHWTGRSAMRWAGQRLISRVWLCLPRNRARQTIPSCGAHGYHAGVLPCAFDRLVFRHGRRGGDYCIFGGRADFLSRLAWLAAGVALLSLVFEIYWGWWNTFLCAMNRVQSSARIGFVGYGLRLAISPLC